MSNHCLDEPPDEEKYGRVEVTLEEVRRNLGIRLRTLKRTSFDFGRTPDERDRAINALVTKLTAEWGRYHITRPAGKFDAAYREALEQGPPPKT